MLVKNSQPFASDLAERFCLKISRALARSETVPPGDTGSDAVLSRPRSCSPVTVSGARRLLFLLPQFANEIRTIDGVVGTRTAWPSSLFFIILYSYLTAVTIHTMFIQCLICVCCGRCGVTYPTLLISFVYRKI